jgi:uncharacterized membrane protein
MCLAKSSMDCPPNQEHVMEKIMVIAFDSEPKAYEGIQKLERLDADGSITIHQGALLRRDKDGSIVTENTAFAGFPVQTLAGTALGALIGLLGGPVGASAGAALGATAGMLGDVVVATLDEDFMSEVSSSLKPGAAVVLLDVSEDWITPVDTELESHASSIVRRPKLDVEDDLLAKRAEANDQELSELEREMTAAATERKAKLQARIDELKARMRAQVARFEEKKQQVQSENQTKREALRQKVSSASSNARTNIQARLDALEQADLEFTARVDRSVAEKLRKVADHIERGAG